VDGYEAHPNAARARELYESGTTYWSAGVFLWRRDDIRAAIERYTPLLTLIEPAYRSELALTAAYDRMQPLSIDETVLAGAAGDGAVVTIPLDVGWRAIGG
jgi:mannose-1-phosphate guanylyltransferase